METNYTLPKSPLIKETVSSFWQVYRLNNPYLRETIVPKGIVEIIFSFETTKSYVRINQQSQTIPRCFIQGFNTCPVQLHSTDRQTFFGVVLNPTAAKRIFNFRPVELANCIIDLGLIDTSVYTLWHRLGDQANFNDRVSVFEEWLFKRLPQLTAREKAFNDFLSPHGDTHISVPELANRFGYSSKQLSRKLYELTGLNTQQTLLYKKYLQTVHLIHDSELSLTEIAYKCHFFDQSHFIRTFKSLTQLTPKEYRHSKSDITGHIFENVH